MPKRWYAVLFLVCGILAALLVTILSRSAEPSYEGRSLSWWLGSGDGSSRAGSGIALNSMGTNALPHLLRWIQYERPAWTDELLRALGDGRIALTVNRWMLGRGTIAYQARGALIFLGQKANPVMPELVRLMGDVKARDTSFRAAEVLSTWGTPETLPSLVAVLTNQQNPARLAVLINLSKLGTNALVAVPALRKCLVDPDPSVRDEATNTLWSLAPEELPADVVWRMVPSRPQY